MPNVLDKHMHPEGFCHMKYREEGGDHVVSIWNSRNGVTPFITGIDSTDVGGANYQHIDWQLDRCDPDYEPKVGDLIFVDEEVESLADKCLTHVQLQMPERSFREYAQEEFGTQENALIARKMAEKMMAEHGEPPPALVVVTEDIACGYRIAMRNRRSLR